MQFNLHTKDAGYVVTQDSSSSWDQAKWLKATQEDKEAQRLPGATQQIAVQGKGFHSSI